MRLKKIILYATLLVGSCTGFTRSANNWTKENLVFADKQLRTATRAVAKSIAEGPTNVDLKWISPRSINKDGTLRIVTYLDWTCGFFPGTLWYMYENTGNKNWRKTAKEFTELMEGGKDRTNTHDVGFLMYCSYGNGYRLTKDSTYKQILIQSARSLITRYSPKVGCIRSWDFNRQRWNFPVIIDNMMNLEILFWAAKATGEKQFYDIAVSHANTTLKNHFRDDNSCYHVVDYFPETGAVRKKETHQGFSDSSSWARGQAWGLYGFTLCYRETNDKKYLEQAVKIAEYILSNPNLPKDLIPWWDYDAPKTKDTPRDVSAAMITASALYELSQFDTTKTSRYLKCADTILQNVTENYRTPLGSGFGFLLQHSTGNKPSGDEIDVPISYADYYFMEALTRKAKLDQRKKK